MSKSFYCEPKDLLHYIDVTLKKLIVAKQLGQHEQTVLQSLVEHKKAIINNISRKKEPKGHSLETLSLEQLFALSVRCYSHKMSVDEALRVTLREA